LAPNGASRETPPASLVASIFGRSAFDRPLGLYNRAGNAIGDIIFVADQLTFLPIYKNEATFVGAQFIFQRLSFLIWWG
jgi:hypothetical protein